MMENGRLWKIGALICIAMLILYFFTKDINIVNGRIVNEAFPGIFPSGDTNNNDINNNSNNNQNTNNTNNDGSKTNTDNNDNNNDNQPEDSKKQEENKGEIAKNENKCTIELVYNDKKYSEGEEFIYKPNGSITINSKNHKNVKTIKYGVNNQILGEFTGSKVLVIDKAYCGIDTKQFVITVVFNDDTVETHAYLFRVNEEDL